MSCEENRIKYFEQVSRNGGVLAGALGGEGNVMSALEQIFNTARNNSAAAGSPILQHRAAGRTLQLFEEMERSHNLARPTHSVSGLSLPKRNAQFGYQAVYDTIEAARSGKALPEVAVRVLSQRQTRRSLTSLRVDAHGYYRCTGCGRFASRSRAHMCPLTTTSGNLERALQRRLGVPDGAYMCTNANGADLDGLQELLDAARSAPSVPSAGVRTDLAESEPGVSDRNTDAGAGSGSGVGSGSATGAGSEPHTVRMTHCLSGEEVDVTLDGIPSALGSGFVPLAWRGRKSLAHIELTDGRVVAVLNAHGARRIDPGFMLTPGMPPTQGSTPRSPRGSFMRPSASGKIRSARNMRQVQLGARFSF